MVGQKVYISKASRAAQASRQVICGSHPSNLFTLSTEIAVAFPGMGDLIVAAWCDYPG